MLEAVKEIPKSRSLRPIGKLAPTQGVKGQALHFAFLNKLSNKFNLL
jgi:hypothetical protein